MSTFQLLGLCLPNSSVVFCLHPLTRLEKGLRHALARQHAVCRVLVTPSSGYVNFGVSVRTCKRGGLRMHGTSGQAVHAQGMHVST